MDKKKSLLNVIFGILFKFLVLFSMLFARRILIKEVGNEANGVISLFTSVIGFLAVAELGVGVAITFCMYKPIIDGDTLKVAALYNLFKKLYLIIGSVIFVVGLIITPFIKLMATDYSLDYNIYLLFIIQLISVVITYLYSANISLINAYKNNYITTIINSSCQILKSFLQILLLITTHSLYLYLLSGIVVECLQTIILMLIVKKRYSDIVINNKEKIDEETKKEVTKNIKAMFMHKIGGVIVNTIDSMVISIVLGVVVLGYYSNYITVVTALIGIINLIFSQLTSVVGHAFYQKDDKTYRKYFILFYLLNYFVGTFSFICFFACVSPFINIVFGENLLLSDSVLFVITFNYFIQFMEQAVRLFKDSSGLFYQDRYKCIFESVVNLILSILFVYWIGVVGVIVATIITNLLICHTVEPYVLYKYAFHQKPYKYYMINYIFIGIFIGLTFTYFYIFKYVANNYFTQFIVNGLVASLFSIPSFLMLLFYYHKTYDMRKLIKKIF